ncbi:MAG TPA: hypothetical protein VG866_01600 [Candidatus Paceibacterota bacterium]|nr:hypothetical protein [Candidatus Paceibacterota bacterium]
MDIFSSLTSLGTVITFLITSLNSIIIQLISVVLRVFNFALYLRAFNDMPVITGTWTILRNFSNMLFVVLLIWMAFATIFDSSKYSFQKMIVRFLIVAVLINFSLVLGGLVIDACQVLTNVFLAAIGNPADKLGQYLSPTSLVGLTPGDSGSIYDIDVFSAGAISAIMRLVISAMFLFSILVATFFAVIRIFVIWGLLIISPLAWMANILPGTQKQFYRWWGMFFGWNLFLPVYLFFLYLTLFFLSQRGEITKQIGFKIASDSQSALDKGLIAGLTNSASFSLLFFYIFAAVMLVMGAVWAMQLTTAWTGDNTFKKGVGWATNLVKRIPLPGGGSLDSYQYAYNKRREQFQKQGFQNKYLNKIYGGQEGLERQRAAVAGQWPFRTQRQFTENAKVAYSKAENDYNTGRIDINQLRTLASKSAASSEGYAYRKLLLEKGGMDGTMFEETLRQLRGNPYAINDLVKTAKDAKFDGIKNLKSIALNDSLNYPTLTPARREMLRYVAGDAKMAAGLKEEDLNKAASILGGVQSPETKKFLEDFGKLRPDLVYDFKKNNNILEQPEPEKDATGKPLTDAAGQPIYKTGSKTVAMTKLGAIRKSLDTEAKNIAAMPDDLWKTLEFQASLKHKITDSNVSYKTRKNLRDNLEKILNEQGNSDKLLILESVAPKNNFAQTNQPNQANANQQRQSVNAVGSQQSTPNQQARSGRGSGTYRQPIGFGIPGQPPGTVVPRSSQITQSTIEEEEEDEEENTEQNSNPRASTPQGPQASTRVAPRYFPRIEPMTPIKPPKPPSATINPNNVVNLRDKNQS